MPTLADQIAPKPQEPSGLGGWLASIGDEMAGAFARYGRRSGAQRDASLALLNQASAPGTDPIMGAGQKLLGLAGLITHPLAFFPTREEWDQRLQAAGNDSRIGRSIGGFLSDLPSLIDPQMAAGGAVLATAPLAAKMLNKADDVADASRGFTVFHGTGKESADAIQRDGFKIFGGGDQDQFPIPGISTTPSKSTAQFYAAGENYLKESDRLDPVVMELRVSGDKSLFPSFDRASKEYEAAGGDLADSAAFLQFLKGKGYKGVREGDEYRVFDPADIQVVNTHPMRYGENGLEQSPVSRGQALQGLVGGAESALGGARRFYRGTTGGTERIKEPFAEARGLTFVARKPDSARMYGHNIEEIVAKPGAKILDDESPDFWKLIGRRRPPNGYVGSARGGTVAVVNDAIKKAKEAGYDAVSFSSDADIGTVLINESAFIRGGKFGGAE